MKVRPCSYQATEYTEEYYTKYCTMQWFLSDTLTAWLLCAPAILCPFKILAIYSIHENGTTFVNSYHCYPAIICTYMHRGYIYDICSKCNHKVFIRQWFQRTTSPLICFQINGNYIACCVQERDMVLMSEVVLMPLFIGKLKINWLVNPKEYWTFYLAIKYAKRAQSYRKLDSQSCLQSMLAEAHSSKST